MTTRESHMYLLQAELDAANARNNRLSKENAQLREQLECFNGDERSQSIINVEARLKAFQFENERDRMYDNLEKLKRKYNLLHDAFLSKLKRCKALEEVFNRQKTLTGLVMKSAILQRDKEQKILKKNGLSPLQEQQTIEAFQNQVVALQKELVESYDIIDEMEFELESIDFLEMENQRLQEQLFAIERKSNELTNISSDVNGPAEHIEIDGAKRETDSTASSLADSFAGDMDVEDIERAALTESLIKVAEAESKCLRRELLRSRLQRTIRSPMRQTSCDA